MLTRHSENYRRRVQKRPLTIHCSISFLCSSVSLDLRCPLGRSLNASTLPSLNFVIHRKMLRAETFKTFATFSTGCSAVAIIALSWMESLLSFIFFNSSSAFAMVSPARPLVQHSRQRLSVVLKTIHKDSCRTRP